MESLLAFFYICNILHRLMIIELKENQPVTERLYCRQEFYRGT